MATIRYDFLAFLDASIQIGETNKTCHIRKIEIPSIQRDYAQGRLGEGNKLNETGNRFINTIFDFLTGSEKMFELDFIYGSICLLEENDYKFIPLDGQQRLTTLFLLYWFVGKIELDSKEQINLMEKLARFSYATRTSARRFCEKMTDAELKYTLGERPSDFFKKQKWFRQAQKDDPTVDAMLNMLDAISNKYVEFKRCDLWGRLEHMKFYVQPLEDFNLTEELYVKMNARGKPLTALENFKAELVRWMTKDGGELFQKRDGEGYYFWLRIARKMDNDWLNKLFWTLLPKSKKEGTDPAGAADVFFYRFICRYVLMQYSIKNSNDTTFTKQPEGDKTFAFLADEEDYRNLDQFRTLLSSVEIANVERILDKLCKNSQEVFAGVIPSWGSTSTGDSFLFGDKISQPGRLIFYGVTSFLSKDDPFDPIKYKQWMRVVWNIVQNTDIDHYNTMNGVLGLLKDLSPETIYQDLPTIKTQSNAGQLAMKEEREKCSLIQEDSSWEEEFIALEKHPFFKGCIGFILDENIDMDTFSSRSKLLRTLFDDKGIAGKYRDSDHLLIRALISRYTKIEDLNEKHFFETDEDEHYLKKMLAGDEVIRKAIRELVSQADVSQMESLLNSWIDEPSQMCDALPQGRYRFIHERLYRSPLLQEWIQNANNEDKRHILKVSVYDNRYFVDRYRSWYMWTMIDGFRNEIIAELLSRGYSLSPSYQQCTDAGGKRYPFFRGLRDEVVQLRKTHEDTTNKITIDRENVNLSIIQMNQGEISLEPHEYQTSIENKGQVTAFVDTLEQCFNEESSRMQTPEGEVKNTGPSTICKNNYHVLTNLG